MAGTIQKKLRNVRPEKSCPKKKIPRLTQEKNKKLRYLMIRTTGRFSSPSMREGTANGVGRKTDLYGCKTLVHWEQNKHI